DFSTRIQASFELFAIWASEYHVVRIIVGGEVIEEKMVMHGTQVQRPENPIEPEGYEGRVFMHWSMQINGNQAFRFETNIVRSITLHAVWSRGEVEQPGG
ncbi:MAG: hypothetical protein FWE01_03255, partial [Firmicutes bacterium]|nr:hypothetical protein [Bacillota bacterium]